MTQLLSGLLVNSSVMINLRLAGTLLAQSRANWWLPGTPRALVISGDGEPLGVITLDIPAEASRWDLACRAEISWSSLDAPKPSFPRVVLQRLGAELFEAAPVDDGRLEDTPWFWGVVGRLPDFSFLAALRDAQTQAALSRVLARVEEEMLLRSLPPN